MKTGFSALSFLLLAVPSAMALEKDELKALTEAVTDMCATPTKSGQYLQVQGEAKANLPVPIKILKAGIGGSISYDAWSGIPITLDKYKTDPRQCAVQLTNLLLPEFKPAKPPKATKTRVSASKTAPALFEDGSSASVETFWSSGAVRIRVTDTQGKETTTTSAPVLVFEDSRIRCNVRPAGTDTSKGTRQAPWFFIEHSCTPLSK